MIGTVDLVSVIIANTLLLQICYSIVSLTNVIYPQCLSAASIQVWAFVEDQSISSVIFLVQLVLLRIGIRTK